MPAAMSAPSNPCAAAMCFRTRSRSAKAKIRNGSTRWRSTAANCGARAPIQTSRFPSRPSSLIWKRPDMALDPAAARRAADALPDLPRDAAGPVFHEPWEAQAFAMALALHERGLFTWSEWAATLAQEIKAAQAAGDPD